MNAEPVLRHPLLHANMEGTNDSRNVNVVTAKNRGLYLNMENIPYLC